MTARAMAACAAGVALKQTSAMAFCWAAPLWDVWSFVMWVGGWLGDAVTLADVVIVPQIFNAKRFDCRLDHVPTVMGIFDRCMELPAFIDAQPARQPDAE